MYAYHLHVMESVIHTLAFSPRHRCHAGGSCCHNWGSWTPPWASALQKVYVPKLKSFLLCLAHLKEEGESALINTSLCTILMKGANSRDRDYSASVDRDGITAGMKLHPSCGVSCVLDDTNVSLIWSLRDANSLADDRCVAPTFPSATPSSTTSTSSAIYIERTHKMRC